MLGDLSARYESNGDPGCISDGYGDPGGKSYGTYQFSSNAGSLDAFCNWLQYNYPQYAEQLNTYPMCSTSFDEAWRNIAASDSDGFAQAQHEYVKATYYDPAVEILANNYWRIENHNAVMQDVVWSRAVQYGVGNILDMWTEAVHSMYNVTSGGYDGYPNLSYIDANEYDYDFIVAIYTVCKSEEWNSSALRDSLNNRFDSEMHDALARL
jgi:hypothetical protein